MSAGKKNDNKTNPIEVIALEISEGLNFLVQKLIEYLGSLIKFVADSIISKNEQSKKKKNSINMKRDFKK
jgi:hypothetical protein